MKFKKLLKNLGLGALAASLFLAFGNFAQADTILGIDKDTGDICIIDTTTGMAALLVDVPDMIAGLSTRPIGVGPNGLAYDSATNRIYFASFDPGSPSELFFYDANTGMFVHAGPLLFRAASAAISGSPGSYFYVAEPASDDLREVSLLPDGTISVDMFVADMSIIPGPPRLLNFGDIVFPDSSTVLGVGKQNPGIPSLSIFSFPLPPPPGGPFTESVEPFGTGAGEFLNMQLAIGQGGTIWGHEAALGTLLMISPGSLAVTRVVGVTLTKDDCDDDDGEDGEDNDDDGEDDNDDGGDDNDDGGDGCPVGFTDLSTFEPLCQIDDLCDGGGDDDDEGDDDDDGGDEDDE